MDSLVTPILIAHRGGAKHAPENTLAAFKRSTDAGASCVELDVQLSQDGVPVIFHDETLERTAQQQGYLHDYPLKKLQAMDVGSWFSKEFHKERIPTLEALFSYLPPHTNYMIELKEHLCDEDLFINKVHYLLSKSKRNIIAGSLSVRLTQKLEACQPCYPLVGIIGEKADISPFLKMNLPYYAVDQRLVLENSFPCLSSYTTWCWTVNQQEELKALLRYPIQGIITDDIDLMGRTLARHK